MVTRGRRCCLPSKRTVCEIDGQHGSRGFIARLSGCLTLTQVFLVFVAACLGLACVLFGAVVLLWS